ncbi:MAG: DNA repair protein RecO [Phycisphaerales bacterium]
MSAARDEAICVRQWDWSETSQTVSLLTRGHGLVRAVAKGSRRPTAPFSGGIELLTRAEIGLIVKPTSDLALLTEWDLVEHFPELRRFLPVYHAGLYGAELVIRMISDHDPHPEVFDALLDLLRSMHAPTDVDPALLTFQRTLLRASGYEPVLDRDVRTGGPLGDARVAQFVPELGGVLPPDVRPLSPEGRPLEAWPVRRGTLAALVDPSHATADDLSRGNKLLASYIRTLIGASPRTLNLVFPGLGVRTDSASASR